MEPGINLFTNFVEIMNDQKIRFIAINAFVDWLYSAHPDFIEVAWSESPFMARHLREKLTGLIKHHSPEGYMSIEVLGRFVRQLDYENTEILYNYILRKHWRQ